MAEAKLRMVLIDEGLIKRTADRLIWEKGEEIRWRIARGEKEIGIGEKLAEGNGYSDGVLDLLRAILDGGEKDD